MLAQDGVVEWLRGSTGAHGEFTGSDEGQEDHASAIASRVTARLSGSDSRRGAESEGLRSSARVHAVRGKGEGNGQVCKAGALVDWRRTPAAPPVPECGHPLRAKVASP